MARRLGIGPKTSLLDTVRLAFCATHKNYGIYDKVVFNYCMEEQNNDALWTRLESQLKDWIKESSSR